MRRCERCGCVLSRYASSCDRFCFPCHPKREVQTRKARVCAQGHDLDITGVSRSNGKAYCGVCRREHERARYTPRHTIVA